MLKLGQKLNNLIKVNKKKKKINLKMYFINFLKWDPILTNNLDLLKELLPIITRTTKCKLLKKIC